MSLIPIFDLVERDRRWGRLRQLMAEQHIDCLIGFPNGGGHWDQFQAGLRYLTQIGGNTTEVAVVFPQSGQVTGIVRGDNEVAWWGRESEWITDLRTSGRTWAKPVIDRIKELKLDRSTIGVIGLSGSPRSPEGLVPSGVIDALREQLGDATLVNASSVVDRARAVKSPAEVDFQRSACGLCEAAAKVMVETARPGVPEREVFGSMYKAIIVGGGEVPAMLHFGSGPEPPWPTRLVTNRVLEPNDVINNEIEAKWSGYVAQVVQPMVLGQPPEWMHKCFDTSRTIFDELRGAIRPGVTFATIVDLYQQRVREAGYVPGAALMHGRGLGEDAPLVMGKGGVDPKLTLEEGNVFILKPAVFPPQGDIVQSPTGQVTELAVRTGDTVVVTKTGAERLGKRKLEIATL